MKIYHLPKLVKALIFDIDLTLYDGREYYDSQEYLLINRLSQHLGVSFKDAEDKVLGIREEFKRVNEGRSLSLGNTFLKFGISIDENVKWRNELFKPEDFLKPDLKLMQTLEKLEKNYEITAVTNNTTNIGIRTLEALGISKYFPIVIGLDISGESKPTMKPFTMISEKLDIPLNQILSIGDRFAVDLELPIENGMGGILVEKIPDVYELPSILSQS